MEQIVRRRRGRPPKNPRPYGPEDAMLDSVSSMAAQNTDSTENTSPNGLKDIVDGTILLAVRSIIQKAKTGKKLTTADLKLLKELRAAMDAEADDETNWDREWRKYKALLAKIDYDVQRGKYLPVEDMVQAWTNRYTHLKRHLLLWSKRLCGRLARQPEARVMEIIDEEVHHLLTMLSRPGRFCPEPETETEESR